MQSILRAAALASAFALTVPAAFADVASDNAQLEARVRDAASQVRLTDTNQNLDWHAAAARLAKEAPVETVRCTDASAQVVAGKYAVTKDASGALCRIYDLSFPTLQTLTAHKTVSKLPVQAFTAHDFLAWIDGNYDEVLTKIQGFTGKMAGGDKTELAGWTSGIRFKANRVRSLGALSEAGLPRTFTAADLDLGSNFRFSDSEKAALEGALQSGGVSVLSVSDQRAWGEAIEHPESLLSHIQFNWNDLDKVYEIFLDGQFLPVRGPIALVDFSAQYKAGVERILRSLVHSAFNQVVAFVPAGPTQALVKVAIDESFYFVDQAYDYQLNQLEGTLRAASSSEAASVLGTDGANRGLNLLFGATQDIVTQYITAAIKQQPFDWNNFEAIGYKTRYAAEKTREIALTNMNSQMVLKSGCQMTLVDNYFGICTKNGQQTFHSLISTNTVLFWNLGGPELYQYGSPNAVLMKRAASYVLGLGASVITLPVANFVMPYLATALKGYATAGITDEAFHRNSLYLSKQSGNALSADDQSMLSVMYLQNLNLLLPKSESTEASVISKNLNLLTGK